MDNSTAAVSNLVILLCCVQNVYCKWRCLSI